MPIRISQVILSLLLFVGLAQPAAADDASAEAAARELIALTGSAKLGVMVMDQMLNQMRSDPRIPEDFIVKFKARAKPEELTNMVVPIYIKHLSEADMQTAIAFYKTPAGKRMIEATPVITQEAMMAGQQWGLKIVTEIQKEMVTPKK